MQNVNAVITFTLTDDAGTQMHNTSLEYNGLDEVRVLAIEKHLIDMLGAMHAESVAFVAAETPATGKRRG